MEKTIYAIVILGVVILGAIFLFKPSENREIPENKETEKTIEPNNNNQPIATPATPVTPVRATETPEGLKIEVLKEGQGQEAKNNDTVFVHYTGWLLDGTKFDSSVDRGTPFSFVLGAGQVIKGWDIGVLGMKPGEKRKLTIPANLGYGEMGTPGGPIPPNATLVFEVEFIR